ncbi:MAG: hypothetical protein Q8Q48_03320 [Candidatus Staskawiczbacteria bacterium]|nr:hypothetical protein [Candidatus Staskawiczbacteria bacterium]
MGGITIKNEKISKEEFLKEHNKLSPSSLEANLTLLNKFKEEKKPLLKDNEWSIDKHRIPFITWLLALPKNEKSGSMEDDENQIYRNYPETHYEA